MAEYTLIPDGAFVLGQSPQYPEESAGIKLHMSELWFLTHEVTNAEFGEFVTDTGYVTDAERLDPDTNLANGSAVFQPGAPAGKIWRLDRNANWRAPGGEGTTLQGLEKHPVVHVSLSDARAYAAWANARLPTETEWEYAAQLGLPDQENTISGAYTREGAPVANTWQGVFPFVDTVTDGYSGTSPVGCFEASKVGLYDMIGNVWEWTETPASSKGNFTIKGGSYLCADNFCRRYRPQARQFQELHFSTSHLGFRVVRDSPPDDGA
ncbi:SUMF1/EgtB/PvdO family nonheme iron enzyme [Henriciella litoralis]|uniref:SUMF1/EgtB/PvdO family nonheme iron enzyme n=1 Tax=Henriciella litoralis TaxID=568102 RepID=UPI00111C59FD